MEDVQIKLSALWVSLMLTYLLGDVIRIFAGDFVPGESDGVPVSSGMYVGMAVLMLLPILMVVLSLVLPPGPNRWASIVLAAGLFLFNLAGLPTYPGLYDRFLIVAGLVINVVTIWVAWRWT